jgi:hypothetical protein
MIRVRGQLIHPITGFNTFCGPAVLSALFGITTDEAAAWVRRISPWRKQVRGIYTRELLQLVREQEWETILMPPYCRSVKTLLKVNRADYPSGIYLLNITGHFILLWKDSTAGQWMCIDNHKKSPTLLSAHTSFATRRIDGMYLLLPPRVSQVVEVERPLAQAASRSDDGPESLKELFRFS